jgi:carbon monoxide dehydrogenase subunit G
MEFDNSFDVPLSPAAAFAVLTDIGRVAPCMPGAELTEIVDPQNFRGRISVRLGPVALSFAGNVEFAEIDEANHVARLKAQGSDVKGRGFANAMATFWIEPAAGGSRVLIHSELILSGPVAQYGRGVGVVQATAAQLVGQFAANLSAALAREPVAAPVAEPAPNTPSADAPPYPASSAASSAKPISLLSPIGGAIRRQIKWIVTGRYRK